MKKKSFGFVVLQILIAIALKGQVVVFEIDGEINAYAALSIKKAISQSEEKGDKYIILKINTLGGTLKDAIAVRKAIDQTSLKTIAFVNDNSASAGAIIALACNKLYMSPSSGIGAATPVDVDGSPSSEKINSYVRSLLRASASKNNKNPELAEKIVGTAEENYRVASLTSKEAVDQQIADGIAKNMEELFEKENLSALTVKKYQPGWQESFMSFVLNRWVSIMLLLLMIVGIKWELAAPGFGFPGVMGLACAALFFIPHQLYGFAEFWEIGLFFVGVLLIGLEIFVVPGFGLTGIVGLLCACGSIALSLLPNEGLNFQAVELSEIVEVSVFIILALIGLTISFLWFLPKILQSKALAEVSLQTSLETEQGYTSDYKPSELIGKQGVALSVLKPSGKIQVENRYYDAIAEGDFIEKDTKIIVIESSGNFLKVRRIK